MIIPLHIIDTFTSFRFKGNATPVCLLNAPVSEQSMHSIAKEMNLPVAAFIGMPLQNNIYTLRYFTATGEIPACGHATLAAAKFVSEMTKRDEVCFITIENIIIRTKIREGLIFLSYPRYMPIDCEVEEPLLHALKLNGYKFSFFCRELETLFIELGDPMVLMQLQPDYDALIKSNSEIKEVVVTSLSHTHGYDFLLRSFCPWIGINEDPVTGSVHSVLAHFWGNRVGKIDLKAFQASERGGEVYVKLYEDKVELGGASVTLLKGELEI